MPTSRACCRFASRLTAPWSRFYEPHVLSQQKWARQCQQLTRPKGWQTTFSLPLYGCFLLLAVPVLGKMGRKCTCPKAEQSQNSSAAYITEEEGVTHKNYTLQTNHPHIIYLEGLSTLYINTQCWITSGWARIRFWSLEQASGNLFMWVEIFWVLWKQTFNKINFSGWKRKNKNWKGDKAIKIVADSWLHSFYLTPELCNSYCDCHPV